MPESKSIVNSADMSDIPIIILTEDDVPGAKFKGDCVEEHSNVQLKRWLACRGIKQGGKRAELVQRCKDCILAKRQDVIDISIDQGKWYEKKLHASVSDKPTVIIPIVGWKDFNSHSLPTLFNYGHVYFWLVESMPILMKINPDDEEIGDNNAVITEKPLRRGRQYVSSGFVRDIKVKHTLDITHYKAVVDASMKATCYTVTVSLSVMSGAVKDASCHCKASALCRCSHVSALLLFLSDHVGAQRPACTDLPCQWKKGKKKEPQSINTACYKQTTNSNVINFDPRPPSSTVSDSQLNNFLSDLRTANSASNALSMWETVLHITYSDYEVSEERKQFLSCHVKVLEENLQPAPCGIVSLCACMVPDTLEQSESELWQSHRYSRMTASSAKEATYAWNALVQCGQSDAVKLRMKRFVRKNVWGLDQVRTGYMRAGLENEDIARSEYETNHPTYNVSKSGLWVSRHHPQLACSPDGLVTDPTSTRGQQGLLEIKCLKLFHKYSPGSLLSAIEAGEVSKKTIQSQCFKLQSAECQLRRSHAYFYQIQFQLGVTGFDWCDFVLWSPKGCQSTERIFADKTFITEIFDANIKLWKAVVAPEVAEMRTPRDLNPYILV